MTREQIDNLRRLAPKLRDNREFQEAVIAAIETIHELERQVIEMARTNVGNVKILTDKIAADQVALDAATKAAKTQDEADALAAAAVAANAITPDTAPAASPAA